MDISEETIYGGMDDDSDDIDDDPYDQEELEVYLYSQIHFEENTDTSIQKFTDNDNVQYDITVHGNNKIGYLSYKTTSDHVLNEQLKEKYTEDLEYQVRGKSVQKLQKASSPKGSLIKSSNKTVIDNENTTLQGKEKSLGLKLQKQNASLAEKLILGSDSESESPILISDNDPSFVMISDNDEKTGDSRSLKQHSSKTVQQRRVTTDTFIEHSSDSESVGLSSDGENTDLLFNVIGGKLPRQEKEPDESFDEGDWKIDYADTTVIKQNRYFKPVVCFNCKQRGHMSKTCPKPKRQTICCLCSEVGHIAKDCPDSFCYNCWEMGHAYRECRMSRASRHMVCYRCKMEGHSAKNCPDLWRQFHLTTVPGKLVRGKPRKRGPLSCYNCGGDDHYGHVCEEDRVNRYVRINTPFVCQYRKHDLHQEVVSAELREDRLEDNPNKKRKTKCTGMGVTEKKESKRKQKNVAAQLQEDKMKDYPKKQRKTKCTTMKETIREKKKSMLEHAAYEQLTFMKSFGDGQSALDDGRTSTSLNKGAMERKGSKKQKKKVSTYVHFDKKRPFKDDRSNPDCFKSSIDPDIPTKKKKRGDPSDSTVFVHIEIDETGDDTNYKKGKKLKGKGLDLQDKMKNKNKKEKINVGSTDLGKPCTNSFTASVSNGCEFAVPQNARGFRTSLSFDNLRMTVNNRKEDTSSRMRNVELGSQRPNKSKAWKRNRNKK